MKRVNRSFVFIISYLLTISLISLSSPAFGVEGTIVGSVDQDGNVYVSGNYAYVASDSLRVVDISNPTSPTVVGSVSIPNDSGSGVSVSGNYAYVGGSSGGLYVIDISNPASPSIVYSEWMNTDNAPQVEDIFVSGTYAYLSVNSNGRFTSSSFLVYDISNPLNPSRVGGVGQSRSRGYLGIHVSGSYAYMCGQDGSESSLRVIDIRDLSSPTIVSSVDTPGSAYDVYVSGNYAYVADGDSGLQIVDVSNLANPTIVSSVDTPGSARDVYVSGNYAYIADYHAGLHVVDISNPTNPTIATSVDIPGRAYDVYVPNNGYYVFVAWGLQVIQMTASTPSWTALKSSNGRYVTAINGGGGNVAANSASIGNYEKFWLTELLDGKVALKTNNGHYVGAISGGGGNVAAEYYHIDTWEAFDRVDLGNNQIALKTNAGHYLSALNGGGDNLAAYWTSRGSWETFTLTNTEGNNRAEVEAFVTRFYQQCLLREPDSGGLNYYTDHLINGTRSGADVAGNLINSPEFLARNTTNEEYLIVMYRAFFNREPDDSGWNYYMTRLNNGVSRDTVFNGFIYSPEFEDLCDSYGISPYSA